MQTQTHPQFEYHTAVAKLWEDWGVGEDKSCVREEWLFPDLTYAGATIGPIKQKKTMPSYVLKDITLFENCEEELSVEAVSRSIIFIEEPICQLLLREMHIK